MFCEVLCEAAFLAALAFAMLSLRAFDDLENFLVSISDCCSWVRSCAVDAVEDFLDSVEVGDRILIEVFDGTFRVFFTWRHCDGASVSGSVGFVNCLLKGRRGFDVATPVDFAPSYRLILECRFNFEGLSTAAMVSW